MSKPLTARSGVQSNVIDTAGEDSAELMSLRFYLRAWGTAALTVQSLAGLFAVAAASLFSGCGDPPRIATPPADAAARAPQAAERVTATRRLMGVPWTITVYAPSQAAGAAAVEAGFTEVARLEALLSDYDPMSEVSRLSAQAPTAAPVPIGDDLGRVLTRAVAIRDATGGGFDPTVGPLTTLGRQARRTGRLPTADKRAAARAAVGRETLLLEADGRAAVLTKPGMRLDLGGIGMGYAVDRALEILGQMGIEAAMIDASGDIAVSGPPPGTQGWVIDAAPLPKSGAGPGARMVLTQAAVTTSGDAYQAVEIEGRRYSHIVDPRTGLGVAGPAAVTVVARDCTTADALATAASVLGPDAAAAVIAAEPGCAAWFVWAEQGELRQVRTPRWPAQATPDAASP
jgi:thiamine biosynthesis lipoprotein